EKENPARLVFLRPRALTSPPGPIKSLSGIHPPRTYEVPAVGTCLPWTAAWATLTTSTTNDYQPVPRLPFQQTRSIQHPASSQAVPFASHRIAPRLLPARSLPTSDQRRHSRRLATIKTKTTTTPTPTRQSFPRLKPDVATFHDGNPLVGPLHHQPSQTIANPLRRHRRRPRLLRRLNASLLKPGDFFPAASVFLPSFSSPSHPRFPWTGLLARCEPSPA
ncbi:hypothetical protein EDB80DRAFT_614743, partial [Ilyonectria destructans]